MSTGEKNEMVSSATNTEDFSPPSRDVDILDLIVKFQVLGPDTQAAIDTLRSEQEGGRSERQSERLMAGALVERGYLTEEELDGVVLARYLLACGKLTMAQLELVMDEIKDTRAPLWVSLVAKGWVKMSDIV